MLCGAGAGCLPPAPPAQVLGKKKVFPSRMGKHALVYKGGKRGGSKRVVLFLKNKTLY